MLQPTANSNEWRSALQVDKERRVLVTPIRRSFRQQKLSRPRPPPLVLKRDGAKELIDKTALSKVKSVQLQSSASVLMLPNE